MTYTDNIDENDFVSRPDLKYITENIDNLIYNSEFNYEISPILEWFDNKFEVLHRYEINLKNLYSFLIFLLIFLKELKIK